MSEFNRVRSKDSKMEMLLLITSEKFVELADKRQEASVHIVRMGGWEDGRM